ncbi:MAG TPA: thioester reductase [Coriobacteriia bacterium]|nr:thioester reductase [Coriobacteriia bacterium]
MGDVFQIKSDSSGSSDHSNESAAGPTDRSTGFFTITEAFAARVRANPSQPAVSDENRTLTYAELDRLSDSIAARFPGKARFVGVIMDHGVEMIASLLAVLKAGAAYVPIEPGFPPERIRFMMEQSDASFIVTEGEYVGLCGSVPVVTVQSGAPIPDACRPFEKPDISPSSLAYVLYTSGTTGYPKGVMVEHRNVCHYARAFCAEFDPRSDDVMLQNSVCTFDIFVEEVFTTLLSGSKLAIPSAPVRDDMSALLDFIERQGVTIISGFPYLLNELNKLDALPRSVRLLISGGDVLRADHVTHLIGKLPIYNTYGPTETTVCATYHKCNGYEPLEDGTYPIGRAIQGVEVALLDDELRPVDPGEIGEICIKGAGVSRGYLGDMLRHTGFITDTDGSRIYRSGDMGRLLPDGNLHFLRRRDKQVMIGGKRVEPQEVESVLGRSERVEHAVVTAELDESGLAYLTAYVVPTVDGIQVRSLREYLVDYVPEYMVPEHFVILEDMPLTASGKIDRLALLQTPEKSPL